jgi:hypothetical protein
MKERPHGIRNGHEPVMCSFSSGASRRHTIAPSEILGDNAQFDVVVCR